MAATQRVASPPTEPFPALDPDPRTPTSLASPSNIIPTANSIEHTTFLRPHSQKSDLGSGDLSPKSGRPAALPVTLTGAAAEAELRKRKYQRTGEDSRETSPNPAVQAMQSLMGSGGISKPSDAPAPDKLSEPMQKVPRR